MIDRLKSAINANDPLVHAKKDGQERAKSRQQKELKALGYQAKKKIRLKPTSLEISINCYLDKTRTIAKNKEANVKYIQIEEQVTSAYG